MIRLSHLAGCLVLVLGLAACGGREPERSLEAPASAEAGAGPEERAEESAPLRTLAELLRDEPRFSTLNAAIEAAGLAEMLEGEGPITLFAPSNDAFGSLPDAYSVEVLTTPENVGILKAILAYHVVPGDFGRGALLEGSTTVATAAGVDLPIDVNGSVIVVGSNPGAAVVVIPDLKVANGIVHIIDAVLLPPAE